MIFAFNYCGIDYFPVYALDPQHGWKPYSAVAEILAIFDGELGGWSCAFWFYGVNGYLGGKPPREVLVSDPDCVIAAAKLYMQPNCTQVNYLRVWQLPNTQVIYGKNRYLSGTAPKDLLATDPAREIKAASLEIGLIAHGQNYQGEKNGMLDLAVMHLNASVGPVLSSTQLAAALRIGSIGTLSGSPEAAAAAAYLFVELEPDMVARCAYEAEADLHHADSLYKELFEDSLPRVPDWEAYVARQNP